ncbi:MAG: helix-turn-helix transcriptional regulator [Gemmatimonadaceae bacterium]|nr:helix-turn-helix transcriptional regulator [Gemmatimonadaceae bacterium]
MATRTNARRRNQATDVIDAAFSGTPGWAEKVALGAAAFEIAEEVLALRERHGLTQAALAERVGTTQSAIARLENASYAGHSTAMLRRIALAVGERVSVRFVPV